MCPLPREHPRPRQHLRCRRRRLCVSGISRAWVGPRADGKHAFPRRDPRYGAFRSHFKPCFSVPEDLPAGKVQALTQANARACHNGLAKVKCFVARTIFLLQPARMLRRPLAEPRPERLCGGPVGGNRVQSRLVPPGKGGNAGHLGAGFEAGIPGPPQAGRAPSPSRRICPRRRVSAGRTDARGWHTIPCLKRRKAPVPKN